LDDIKIRRIGQAVHIIRMEVERIKRNFLMRHFVIQGKVISIRSGVAQRVGRGLVLLFLDHGTRRG